MQSPKLRLQSQDSTQGNRSPSSGPGVLPGVLLAPDRRHLCENATPMTSSHPSPTAPSPLHHHSQPGSLRSCFAGVPHLRFLRHAQAVDPDTSICCPVRHLVAHLQRGGHLHGSSRSSDPGPVDQGPSVSRAGISPPHHGSARTPRRPSRSLPSSPPCFIDHFNGSTPSNLSSPGA